ncbi:hypothetical protein [Nocardioides sp. URHA0032]|uniref:hypothetical protein n=1 Tax=Nocardioides sp. URHA0032 TaxID=1380388 RepID=UPI00048F2963|nr:hypothetical protein [Nocardioides sp. URHA0032]
MSRRFDESQVGATMDVATLREVELRAGRQFIADQFTTMSSRHDPEDIITLQVLLDYGQEAAQHAKAGDLLEARRLLSAVDAIELPDDDELSAARELSTLPVHALVHWKEGNSEAAIADLTRALDAGRVLAEEFGHGYLTVKLIHLASNVARVDQSQGRSREALAEVTDLRAVIDGDAAKWRYGAASMLRVPLKGVEHGIIDMQLERTTTLAAQTQA